MILTHRLKTAAEMAEGADRIIDVGCDHGYLAAYMLMSKNASFVFASDINPEPLKRAEETINKYDLSDKSRLCLCAGLETFFPDDADTVFICGMGGELISEILNAAPWTRDGKHTLILQPMTKDEHLRRFLFENGYKILDERIAQEGKRIYSVIKARGGESTEQENLFLFSDSMKKDLLFKRYLEKKLAQYRKVLKGKEKAAQNTDCERYIIRILEENYGD